MTKTWNTPPAGEVKATVCPSGESMARFMGLFQWLICAILAGPDGDGDRCQYSYPPNTTASTAKIAKTAPTSLFPGFGVALLVTLAGAGTTGCTTLGSGTGILPELESLRMRFRSARISAADW